MFDITKNLVVKADVALTYQLSSAAVIATVRHSRIVASTTIKFALLLILQSQLTPSHLICLVAFHLTMVPLCF